MVEIREKVYQMFILGTEGDGYKKALSDGLGGIIFFTKDIISSEQILKFNNECRKLAKISPFLAIDQEGGRVERTENIHGGKKYLSARYAFQNGILEIQTEKMANELKNYGFNLNFAPCVDVNTNPNNPIIGERSFSSNPEDVITAAKIVCNIYSKSNIITCIKHFPGHGDTDTDSHLALPQINLSLEEMEKTHILPFKSLIESGIDMVMVAHIYCTCFDSDILPASLSKNAISYLRDNLKYDGIIISDDMIMKGVSDKFSTLESCLKGIDAGLDMFIFRNSNESIINAIEQIISLAENNNILAKKIDNSYAKILKLKEKFSI